MNAKNLVYILDSFALLAFLEGEVGMARVKSLLQEAETGKCRILLSIINLGEIAYIIERERGITETQAALGKIRQMPIDILSVSDENIFHAAHIKANYPVFYADAFVIAIAQNTKGIVLTGDPEFKKVEELIQVEWLER